MALLQEVVLQDLECVVHVRKYITVQRFVNFHGFIEMLFIMIIFVVILVSVSSSGSSISENCTYIVNPSYPR